MQAKENSGVEFTSRVSWKVQVSTAVVEGWYALCINSTSCGVMFHAVSTRFTRRVCEYLPMQQVLSAAQTSHSKPWRNCAQTTSSKETR